MNRLITLLFILLSFNSIAQESWKKNGLIPTMSWGGISEAEISESSYRKLKEVGVTIDIAFFQRQMRLPQVWMLHKKQGLNY